MNNFQKSPIDVLSLILIFYSDYEDSSFFEFILILKNSTCLMQSEDTTRALVLEGQFELTLTNKGFEDVIKESMIMLRSKKSNPERQLKIEVKDTTVYICSWDADNDSLFSSSTCRKLLIVEPVKLITYTETDTGIIENDTTCRRVFNRNITADQFTITLTFLDYVYLLNLFQHHLYHMSIDYFAKTARYYKSKLGELNICLAESTPYTYNKNDIPIFYDLLIELNRIYNYYFDEREKLEKMRQELILQQTTFVSFKPQEEVERKIRLSKRFKEMKITADTYVFTMSAKQRVKFLIIHYYRTVFCPLLACDLQQPYFRSAWSKGKDQRDQFTGEAQLSYYNSDSSVWEPLIEHFPIDFTRQVNDTDDIKVFSFYNSFNINISHTFINLMKESWIYLNSTIDSSNNSSPRSIKLKKKKALQSNERNNYETVSEFGIENYSGEIIRVTFKDLASQKNENIMPGEIVSICRDPSDSLSMRGLKNIFRIRIDFDSAKKNIPPIENINLSVVSHFVHEIPSNDSKICLICTIKKKSMRKILTISTSNKVINGIPKPIRIAFFNSQADEEVFHLKQENDELSIPFSFTESKCSILVEDAMQKEKSVFNFQQLEDYANNNRTVQLSIGDNILGVLVCSTLFNRCLHQYLLLPPFRVYNCLPVQLVGNLFPSRAYFCLEPMESTLIYSQSVIGMMEIEITLPRFEKVRFEYDDKKGVFLIMFNYLAIYLFCSFKG